MKRMSFRRPTTHYNEDIKQIDEKLCELIKKRKEISNNDPGYPPFEYITDWAEKFDLYEDLLKSIFSSLWKDEIYKPLVEPKDYIKNLPVLKLVELDNKLFSVISIRQYSNASVVNFNIDWDTTSNPSECRSHHTHYELFINDQYDCRMISGTGGEEHFHFNYVVSPPLPDNLAGIKLTFKEYEFQFEDKQIGKDVVIKL